MFINHALEDVPLYKKDRYFKMLYQRSTHIWVPFFASTGNDGSALAWMSSWYDRNQTSSFVCNGWEIMYKDKYWTPSKNQSLLGWFLDSVGYIGVRKQLNSWVAISFYPIVEKQCSIKATEKLTCAYSWFDNNFGTLLDTDHDGYAESYYYETETIYSNWATANLLLSRLMGENGQQTKDFLRNIYTTKFYEKFLRDEPEVLAVDYPVIRVSRALFDSTTKLLVINLNTEKPMISSTKFEVKYPDSVLDISSITRDGLNYGFTIEQISNNKIRIDYSFKNMDQQDTEFHILFH